MDAQRLRGFGPTGLLALLVILAGNLLFVPLSALLVLVWVRLSGTPWADIGYVRPRSWLLTIALGAVFGVTLKLVMKALVMPLLDAPALNPAYQFLVGNPAALPLMLYLVIVGAGFGEETVFRGFLFERLRTLWGGRRAAIAATILVTSVFFGVVHYPEQGWPGVQQATIVGLLFGTMYAVTRQLPPVMIAHAAFDLAAIAIIYFDLEAAVAHFFFK
jgi:membrane protease YdiL (CAAX protease family)